MLLLACAPALTPVADSFDTPDGAFALVGGVVVGVGPADVVIQQGRITAVGQAPDDVERVDVTGLWILPAAIDSHVHVAYLPEGPALHAAGVAAVVDLAAPVSWVGQDVGPDVIWAGPMVTAVQGYPTQGWGSAGYGTECAGEDQVRDAVRAHHAAGAGVIKVPVGGTPGLTPQELLAAVDEAHGLGLKVAAHALSDASAMAARDAGVDVLAHTPTSELLDTTVSAWADGAVISTLGAFGGRSGENLKRLSDAGATVLYGTDFGNTRDPRIDPRELSALSAAGLSNEQIVAALTQTPAAFWEMEGLGQVAVGARASVLVLAADPLQDPSVLADPSQVWMDGQRLR